MPSKSTTNYQLCQWEAADRVLRTDFNADNAKTDAAIKAVDSRVDGLAGNKADKTALTALSQTVAGKSDTTAMEALTTRVETLEAMSANACGSYEGNFPNPQTIQLPWAPKLLILLGLINDDPSVAYVTQDACFYSTGRAFTKGGPPYCPSLSGSTLSLNIWFSKGTTYYFALR